jgi:hypothetical protein
MGRDRVVKLVKTLAIREIILEFFEEVRKV